MRYKILNAESENFSKEAKKALSLVADVDYFKSLSASEIERKIADYDGLIVRLKNHIGRGILGRAKRLLFVASPTTGLDHIDLKLAKEKSIEVISLFGEKEFLRNIYATAEYTIALMFFLIRNIPLAFDDVKQYKWNRNKFIGRELNGKVLGVVGYGRVGKMVAGYARLFGMKIIAHDIRKAGFERGVKRVGLDKLLKLSDVISIHLPLNDTTTGLFNKTLFKNMAKAPFLINTSRGPIIDESGLLWALKNRVIKGAAIDVLEGERAMGVHKNPLIEYAKKNSNLIITPHIGGATYESMQKTEIFISKKIQGFLKRVDANS